MRRLISGLLGALLLLALCAADALAHGGRFNGPGGRGQPGDPTSPPPPAPKRGKPPTTPPSGIPSTQGALPDIYWGTWWALNRWAYLPERGEALRRLRAASKVVTGKEDPDRRAPEELDDERRALLARQHIKPFLLEMLDPKREEEDTVTSAAMLALAKIDATDETLDMLLKVAESDKATPLERESAALAVGLVRRSDKKLQADPVSLDLARGRLLDLIGDKDAPIRARCFSAFALGLLADQPYGSPFHKDGRMVVKGLLKHLDHRHRHPDLPIALLTSLSLQPRVAIPSKLHDDLRNAVKGANVHRRKWTPIERSHALSTLARLEAPGWLLAVIRSLSDRRVPDPVKRAARIAIGSKAARLSAEQRLAAAKGLIHAHKNSPGALSNGLGNIALARILHAELADESVAVLKETKARRVLLDGATKGPIPVRGFNVLALALSVRDVRSMHPDIVKYVQAARDTLLGGFDRPRGDDDLRGSYVIALGLVRETEAQERFLGVLAERNSGPLLRARVAIALAQIGTADPAVLEALRAILDDDRPLSPRSAAALSLSLITGVPESDALVRQLREAKSQRRQVQAAIALGQLDDPAALPAIIEVARQKEHNFEMRALAIALLGLLGDPEEQPSLLRLSLDANYIGRSDALNEAFTLL